MSRLIAESSARDQLAQRAAVEAVLGLLARRDQVVTEETVRQWLGVVFDENIDMIARASHYSSRIIHGPILAEA